MTSNSKLSPTEKMILKEYRVEQNHTVLYRNSDTTVVAFIGPTVVRFATSVRSPDETKNRNKVGEYRARCRFENGEVSILTRYDFDMLLENADFEEIVK